MSITYGKERILLEIGTAFEPKKEIFDGFVNHRVENYLVDELKVGRVPKVEGIYSRKYLKDYDLQSSEESDLHTTIFISHLHLDHMSCMGLVDDLVDVYLSEPAQKIEYALEEVGKGVPTLRTNGYKVLDPTIEYKIGDIIVKPFLLNEQSYQDYSFYVKTPDMKLHHTGDIMSHEHYLDNVWKEMEYLKNENIDVLVMETTTLMDSVMLMMYDSVDDEIKPQKEYPSHMLSKEKVDKLLSKQLTDKEGLCVFNYYEREMEDVLMLKEMAKDNNRILAFEQESANVIYKYFNEPVNVYLVDKKYEQDWYKELIKNNPVITKKEIWKQPNKYLIQNTYEHILELFDLPNKNAYYLHAGGIPIGEYDPAYQNLKRVIQLCGFKHINFFMENYFSHAYPCQLKYYCDEIQPKVLVPAHGYNPERLLPHKNSTRLLPKKDVTYILKDNQLIEEM